MRIGELSRQSGVPIPTIKYYLRERLLAPGAATAANQADYGDEHLRRLKLIRALIDVGGVSVAGAREVIDALSRDADDPMSQLGQAQIAISPRHHPDRSTQEWAETRDRVLQLINDRGWAIHPESPAVDQVADALAALTSLHVTELLDNLDRYADAAATLAALDIEATLNRPAATDRLELVVLGTVLGEALFAALRMLAHQHESYQQLTRGKTRSQPPPGRP
ncbi:MerR family transcriptional regulator [Actinoplanes sp. NPDC049596]|uniref:MerR family transcriptional regulator n=1 Tax=unclassified Actinoplanes TaxID=2626549 RepID=UPI0034326A83